MTAHCLIYKSIKQKRSFSLDNFLGTFFWAPLAVDGYYFGSGWDADSLPLFTSQFFVVIKYQILRYLKHSKVNYVLNDILLAKLFYCYFLPLGFCCGIFSIFTL